MPVRKPDEYVHNNEDNAFVDSEFVRGGGRVTSSLVTLLTDFSGKEDQLKNNVTLVWVVSEEKYYRLKDKTQLGSLSNGWAVLATGGGGEGVTDYNDLTNKPALGSAAALNVASSGNAASGEVVKGNDSRLNAKAELLASVPTEGDNLEKLYNLIQTLNSIVGGATPDGNIVTDTVAEILAIFSTYPEGASVVSALAGKINTSAIVNTLTEVVTGKVLDATQGKVLKDLIDALTVSLESKAYQADLDAGLVKRLPSRGGLNTQTSDGLTTVFNIPHGVNTTIAPIIFPLVQPGNKAAAGNWEIDTDETNIIISYTVAPPVGQLRFYWGVYTADEEYP